MTICQLGRDKHPHLKGPYLIISQFTRVNLQMFQLTKLTEKQTKEIDRLWKIDESTTGSGGIQGREYMPLFHL